MSLLDVKNTNTGIPHENPIYFIRVFAPIHIVEIQVLNMGTLLQTTYYILSQQTFCFFALRIDGNLCHVYITHSKAFALPILLPI